MCVVVVSLIGRICNTFCCVKLTQSTIFFKSPKSPTPKLLSERNENNGTSVPATRVGGRVKLASLSSYIKASPSSIEGNSMVRLLQFSHIGEYSLLGFRMANLNSSLLLANWLTSRQAAHSFMATCVIFTAFFSFHEPISGSAPIRQSLSPTPSCGARTFKHTNLLNFSNFKFSIFAPTTQSVTADEYRKALSGISRQWSNIL